MTGWNESYNWTHAEFTNVVTKALVTENKDVVCLDTEHTDHNNELQIVAWAEQMGYNAEILNSGDTIKVYKKGAQDGR